MELFNVSYGTEQLWLELHVSARYFAVVIVVVVDWLYRELVPSGIIC